MAYKSCAMMDYSVKRYSDSAFCMDNTDNLKYYFTYAKNKLQMQTIRNLENQTCNTRQCTRASLGLLKL